jgi:streptomycin 6-kinase
VRYRSAHLAAGAGLRAAHLVLRRPGGSPASFANLWEELDHPCSEKVVEHALVSARRRERAHWGEKAVLVHSDVHQLNALQSDDGFKLVDPDGLLAEAEYDLGVLMRGDPVELLAGDPFEQARWLAARTGLDPVATWEWA